MNAVLKRAKRAFLAVCSFINSCNLTYSEKPASIPAPRNTPLKSQPDPVRHEVKALPTSASGVVVPAGVHNGHPNGTAPQTRQPDVDYLQTVIGIDILTGEEVRLSLKERYLGQYDIGGTGRGKTTLKLNMILSDLRQGHGAAVLDPHGDLVRAIISGLPTSRLKDVIHFNLADSADAPVGINLFECPYPRTMQSIAQTSAFLSHVFSKVWDVGTATPRLMMVLRSITRLLIENSHQGANFCDIPLLLSHQAIRDHMVENLTNSAIATFWEDYNRRSQRDRDELVASCLNKVQSFLDQDLIRNIVGQAKTTLDFRQIMDQGNILLISLSPLYSEASSLLASVLTGRLLMAAFCRADTPEEKRRPFLLYCDEYQRYATSDFATLLAEARKFKIIPILSNQSLEQLDEANQAAVLQTGILVSFRVSGNDSKVLARSYDATPQMEQIGLEPLRSPVSDVIAHLVHKGHPDPRVARFAQTYLSNLERYLHKPAVLHEPQYPAYYNCFDGRISLPQSHVLKGREFLNDHLYDAMTKKRSDLQLSTLAIYILAVAQNGMEYILSNWVTKSFDDFKAFKPGFEQFGKPSFTSPVASQAYLSQIAKRWKKRHFWMAEEFVSMLKELRYCLEVLAKDDPILVDTGMYVPQYRKRTYQDQENLIANELSTLPNYTAKVRLLGSEHTIRTLPAPPLLTEREIQERIKAIKNRMLFQGITRPYREVEEEVRKRHEALREQAALSDAAPPTHINGNRRRRKPPPANI